MREKFRRHRVSRNTFRQPLTIRDLSYFLFRTCTGPPLGRGICDLMKIIHQLPNQCDGFSVGTKSLVHHRQERLPERSTYWKKEPYGIVPPGMSTEWWKAIQYGRTGKFWFEKALTSSASPDGSISSYFQAEYSIRIRHYDSDFRTGIGILFQSVRKCPVIMFFPESPLL